MCIMPSSSSIITPFRGLLSVLLFLPFVLACQQDVSILVPLAPGQGETAQVTLSVRIPDFRAAHTRAVDEERISEVTVLMFADEGGTEKVKVKYDVPGSSLHTPSGSSDTRTFSVPVAAGTYRRIALIANAQAELGGITVGSTYDALKQVEATGKFGQRGAPGTPIPMYGEHAPARGFELKAGVSRTIAQSIPLIRMLARVDIINPATSGALTIPGNKVYFVNPVGNGRIWTDSSAYNTTAAQSGYMTPTLPGTLNPAVSGGHALVGVANNTSPEVITYYLNEQAATAGGNRPCIVINLSYQGREYCYRIDYTWDGIKGGGASPHEKGKYMPVLRNHRYIFTIKEVKGPGFRTLEEAVTGPENFTNHNIVVAPIVIDEAFTDIAFNEEGYFLAVTRTGGMALHGRHDATSTLNKFSVHTNYPGGYKITAYNANGTLPGSNPWLKPSQNGGATNATLTNPVTNELQAITSGRGFKEGYLEVRAGRLSTKVNVEQFGVPLDYVAEYDLAGGSAYGYQIDFSEPWGYTSTSAQTDPQLRWATSHAHDQSGYYNWYKLKGIHHATYNPDTKNLFNDDFFKPGHPGHGYHLPSKWELASIFSTGKARLMIGIGSDSSLNINEACEVGGIKKTFANDYLITSSGPSGTSYALRFKSATGNPDNDSWTSPADFPQATDNKMLCAFRYTLLDLVPFYERDKYNNDIKSRLKVDCIYLGETGAATTINAISNNAWWTARTSQIVTRIFPVVGAITNRMKLTGRTTNSGSYWSSTQTGHQKWSGGFTTYGYVGNSSDGSNGYAVRLFADE